MTDSQTRWWAAQDSGSAGVADTLARPTSSSTPEPDGAAVPLQAPTRAAHQASRPAHPAVSAVAPTRRSRSGRAARAEREREAAEKQAHRRRVALGWLVVAALLGGAAFVVLSVLDGRSDDVVVAPPVDDLQDYTGPGHGTVTVVVEKGDDAAAVGRTLEAAGVVANASVFASVLEAAPDVAPGTYRLMLEMRSSAAVKALGDPASRALMRVTVPEGLTTAQILTKITQKTELTMDELTAVVADPKAIGLPAQAGGKVEGWLYPGSYDVAPDATAAQLLSQMTAKTAETLTEAGVPAKNWQAVLTIASLVQHEGTPTEYWPQVARGFFNRLSDGVPLDSLASVSYGAGASGMPTDAMLANTKNPYNLSKRPGLPPTPISSPSAASLAAAAHPSKGGWKFWVTVNPETGETVFVSRYDEYQEYQAQLARWQDEHKS